MDNITYLQLHLRFCKIEVRLNDIVLYRKNEPEISTFALPVHEYLITGQNTFSVRILPHTTQTEFNKESLVWARIATFKEGDFLEFTGGDAAAEMSLEIASIEEERQKKSYEYQHSFLHNAPKTWQWQNAPVLTFSEPVIKALNSVVAEIHSAFVSRNPQPIIKALKTKIEEQAICYPQRSLADRLSGYEKMIRAEDKQRVFEPLVANRVNYQLSANGRLVEVLDSDGLPLIRTRTNNYNTPYQQEGFVALPMHIGRIGEEFAILR